MGDNTRSNKKHDRLAFEIVLSDFVESISGLREYTSVLAGFLDAHHKEQVSKHGGDLYPLGFMIAATSRENEDESDVTERDWRRNIQDATEASGSTFEELFRSGESTLRFTEAMRALSRSTRQKQVLYEQTLLSLVSSANWYMLRLFHLHYERNPNAVMDAERNMTVAKLNTYESIAAAVSDIIEAKVEALVRGSLSEWLDNAKSLLSLSASYLPEYKPRLIEVYLRRNLIVHNGGVVNYSYIKGVDPQLLGIISQGQRLSVSPIYLSQAADTFEVAFILLALEFWKKLEPNSKERGDFIAQQSVNHIEAGRYQIAERLSFFGMNDAKTGQLATMYSRLNYWQSIKWQDRLDEIRAEVEALDTSTLSDSYKLAKLALVDDADAFVALLTKAIRTEQISYAQVETWPIFREMRKDARVQSILSEYGERSPLPAELSKVGELIAELFFSHQSLKRESLESEETKDVTPRETFEQTISSVPPSRPESSAPNRRKQKAVSHNAKGGAKKVASSAKKDPAI